MKKELSSKFATGLVLAGTGIILALFACIIYCVDPLMQYHTPWFGLNMIVCNVWDDITTDARTMEIYYDPGVAKNEDYDSVLVGSSMVQCADTSWFDAAFDCNTEKLTISGLTVAENVLLFDRIFNSHDVKYVFWNYDTRNFTDISDLEDGFPMYLWDEEPLNDVNYLLNKYIMFENLKTMYEYNVYGNWDTNGTNEAYKWGVDEKEFDSSVLVKMQEAQQQVSVPSDYYLEVCKENVEQFIPYIENHPNTTFYISLPPYSIFKWYDYKMSGTLDAVLAAEQYGVSRFLQYDNVVITSLQADKELITNLDYYCDASHHRTNVNQMIINCMKSGEYQLTKDNYMEEIDKIKEITNETDYSVLLGE